MASTNSLRRRFTLGCGVVAVLLLSLILFVGIGILQEERGRLARRENGIPKPISLERFDILVFPKDDVSAPGVQRAVLLGCDELQNESIEVFVSGTPVRMRASAFTASPPEGTEQAMVEGLNRAIAEWGVDTDWRRVDYFVNRLGHNGETVVKLTLPHRRRGARFEYIYRITADGNVIPVWHVIY